MIIDMHTHCFPDPLAEKAMPMLALRSGNPCPAFDGTASGLKESVLSGGADRAAVLNIATNAHQQKKVNDFDQKKNTAETQYTTAQSAIAGLEKPDMTKLELSLIHI